MTYPPFIILIASKEPRERPVQFFVAHTSDRRTARRHVREWQRRTRRRSRAWFRRMTPGEWRLFCRPTTYGSSL